MFKNLAYAAAAAVALTAVPAAAATTVALIPGTNTPVPGPGTPGVVLTPAFGDPTTVNGSFKFAVVDNDAGNSAFSITYQFENPFDPAIGTANASFSVNAGQQTVTFTGATINGAAIDLELADDPLAGYVMVWNTLNPGTNSFTIFGNVDNANGTGSTIIDGGLRINAVPEPGTWALFILGFGAIGAGLRRRNGQVRTAKAGIRFA